MKWHPNTISEQLSTYVIAQHPRFKDRKDNIRYGLEWLISGINQVLWVLVLTVPFGLYREALICLISGALLRMFAGGVHFTEYSRCLIFSTLQIIIISTIPVVFEKFIVNVLYVFYVVLPISCLLLIKNAPKLYKKRFYFNSFQINLLKAMSVFIFLFLCIVCFFIKDPRYQFCIFASMHFQIFTITKLGEMAILSLDNWLSNKFTMEGEK
jgi:accessory gene regulator B